MKKLKKSIMNFICLGMLISSLPIPAKASQSTKTIQINQQKIYSKLNNIKKVTRSFDLIKFHSNVLKIGGAVTAGAIELALLMILLASIPIEFIVDPSKPKKLAFIKLQSSDIRSNPIFQLTVLLTSGFISSPFIYRILGFVSPNNILSAFKDTKYFKKNMNLLNKNQQKIVNNFYKKLKGPILLGIVKGVRLKNNFISHATQIFKQNSDLFKSISNKKALSIAKTYLKLNLASNNLTPILKKFNAKISKIRIKRNKLSKWTPKYHFENIKLMAIEKGLKYLTIKNNLNKTNKKIEKFHIKYPTSQTRLKNIVQSFISNINLIIKDGK